MNKSQVSIFCFKFCIWKQISAAHRARHIRNGGVVFRLYTRCKLDELTHERFSELSGHSLASVCLHARLLVPATIDLEEFFINLPHRPSASALYQALERLEALGALDSQHQVMFPLAPPIQFTHLSFFGTFDHFFRIHSGILHNFK